MNANNSVVARPSWVPRTQHLSGIGWWYTSYTTLPASMWRDPPYAKDNRRRYDNKRNRTTPVCHIYIPQKYQVNFRTLPFVPNEFSIPTIKRVEMLWSGSVFEQLTWRIVPRPDIPHLREFYVRMRDVETVYRHTPELKRPEERPADPVELAAEADEFGYHFCESKYKSLPDFCLELVVDPRIWGPCLPPLGSPHELVVDIKLFDHTLHMWKAPLRLFNPCQSSPLHEILVMPACEVTPWWEIPLIPQQAPATLPTLPTPTTLPTPPTPPTAPPTKPAQLAWETFARPLPATSASVPNESALLFA